jgi:predicted acylesterase/phospholipase RssA
VGTRAFGSTAAGQLGCMALAAGILLFTGVTAAQTAASDLTRPRVGLVLGGGGARGAAHIGVLEVLEKLRVPVDCVAGTSMGALVAGVYASGVRPTTMRSKLAEADWDELFRDDPPLNQQNFRKKVLDKRFLPGSETGVGPEGVKGQPGIVMGQKIKLFFNTLVRDYLGERDIEALPLPLSIIATDIVGGEKVVFRQGSLSQAMRASMSVPGLMAPVEADGKKLVDGGLVDNVPIDEARARCQADIIIAVNVGSPLLKADEIGGLLSVSAQMVNILTEQNVTRSLATLKPTDIYIKPDLEGITAGDFKRSSETADRGVKATEAVADRLRALSVSETAYAAWVAQVQPPLRAAPRVDEVQIAGLKLVNPAVVERYLQIKPGDTIDPLKLDADLMRTYGDGYYEHVDYALDNTLREPRDPARVAGRERLGTRLPALWHQPRKQLPDRLHLRHSRCLSEDLAQQPGRRIPRLSARSGRHQVLAPTSTNRSTRAALLRRGQRQLSEHIDRRSTRTTNKLAEYRPQPERRPGGSRHQRRAARAGAPRLAGELAKSRRSRQAHHSCRRSRRPMVAGLPRSTSTRPIASTFPPRAGPAASNTSTHRRAATADSTPAPAAIWSVGDWVLASRLSYQGSPIGQLPGLRPRRAWAACST